METVEITGRQVKTPSFVLFSSITLPAMCLLQEKVFPEVGCWVKVFEKSFVSQSVQDFDHINIETYKKPKAKHGERVQFALVNADEELNYAYAEKHNERDLGFVGFPFWLFYDSHTGDVLQAGACKSFLITIE